MKIANRILSILLVGACLVGVVACSGGMRSEDPTGKDTNISPEMERRVQELENSPY